MELREKCGIFGIYSPSAEVFHYLYWGMLAQNHRDQLCLGCISNEYPTKIANSIAEGIREKLKKGGSETGRAYESV
jgi:glutamine phosphoribosylpyrophosphate amidotransferase